jgi:hypothetical protein
MGTVVQVKNEINNSYFQLKDSVEEKFILTEEKIKSKLTSDVQLVQINDVIIILKQGVKD